MLWEILAHLDQESVMSRRIVVREGLRLLMEQDEVRLRWRERIERGWLDAQAGRVVDGPATMARIKQRVITSDRLRRKGLPAIGCSRRRSSCR
jgi:hypothetical protein